MTKNVVYISFVHQEPKLLRIDKDANINVGNIPWFFLFKRCFPCGNLTLNVGYYLYLYFVQWKVYIDTIC